MVLFQDKWESCTNKHKWKITVAAQGRMFLGVNYWNAKNKQNKQEAYPWSLFFKNTVFLSYISLPVYNSWVRLLQNSNLHEY